jgi:putative transposase
LLVFDRGVFHAIPRAMQLIASRSAQEYNFRHSRRGAFWEDRYHSTLVENGVHLIRCITYIDLNMVRAGIVQHPADWEYGGFREIQGLQTEFDLVDLNDLLDLISFENVDHLRKTHITEIERAIDGCNLARDKIWTESVAVGSKAFVETINKKLGGKARRSKISEGKDIFALREERSEYVLAALQNLDRPLHIPCQPKQLIIK